MSQPLISVVIPVHNGELYLAAAIQSVLAQEYHPLQITVVDDGSTDSTAKVAASFPGVEYIRQQQAGAAAARNHGVSLARGDYLAFLDADDLWTGGKLHQQLAYLQANPQTRLVFGMVQQFLSEELDSQHMSHVLVPTDIIPAYLPGSLLVRRDDFLRVGDYSTQYEIGETLDWYCRAIERGFTSHVLPHVVLRRRIHRANQGITKQHFQRDYARILKASLDRRRQASQNAVPASPTDQNA